VAVKSHRQVANTSHQGPKFSADRRGASDTTMQSLQHSGTEQDVPLETVLEATGQLNLDEQGDWSYHGHGSSSAFKRRIGVRFGSVSDSGLRKNTVLWLRSTPQIYESPFDLFKAGASGNRECLGTP
jgi:hypothetical protein